MNLFCFKEGEIQTIETLFHCRIEWIKVIKQMFRNNILYYFIMYVQYIWAIPTSSCTTYEWQMYICRPSSLFVPCNSNDHTIMCLNPTWFLLDSIMVILLLFRKRNKQLKKKKKIYYYIRTYISTWLTIESSIPNVCYELWRLSRPCFQHFSISG